jgi:hypothetical protein
VDSIEEGCSYTVRMRDGSFTDLASDVTKEGQNNGR